LIIHLFSILSLGFSQNFINNVLANQRIDGSKIVDISYLLTDGELLTSYTIALEVSTDGGASYQALTYGCTGDIGANRDSGSKSIFWDLNLQYDDKYFPDAKVRVKATLFDRTSTNETPLFTIDTRSPEITILYPNGGEHFPDYDISMVEIGWTAFDETGHGELIIGAYISFELGGWFVPIDAHMENMGYTNLDLSVDGSVPERLWGKLKMTATDFYGNQSVDYSDHYFILGNPQGDMQAQSMDVSTSQVLLDWSWQEDQLIVFQTGALSFLTVGDEFAILDYAGIQNESCQGGYGFIELASLTYNTEMSLNPTALKVNAGVDNCEQGGGRYPGYIPGNPIFFVAIDGEGSIFVTPDMGETAFGDSVIFITGFDVPESENCQDCLYDYTNYGSECCDTAWEEYGLDCPTLEANYGWDCSGCNCPGDNGEPFCGDGFCSDNETADECPEDCMESCGDGYVIDCSGDLDCCPENWIGDGFEDCEDQAYGCDLTCYDNDGGDCGGRNAQTGNMKPVRNINPVTIRALQAGRDYEDFNIYRSTNAPINRDCGGNCGTCSDNLTFNQADCEADGNTWTDLSWEIDDDECICLIVEHTEQAWYFDNFSMTQETWCYHVWLMDENTKLVKTVESCTGLEILMGDLNDDGEVNVLDIVILVNCVLASNCEGLPNSFAGDMNGDGDYNVLDVVVLVNYILSNP